MYVRSRVVTLKQQTALDTKYERYQKKKKEEGFYNIIEESR